MKAIVTDPTQDSNLPLLRSREDLYALSYTERKRRWLREELGLQFDPFEHLDGGADPNLPRYLVDHGAFAELWGDWPSLLFAPPGGGKTAFRVRLMRACRTEQERRIFPILFRPPRPRRTGEPVPEEEFFTALLHDAGAGLLFQLAYQPYGFLDLPPVERRALRRLLEQTLPAPLDYYLFQLKEAGSLQPLAQAFDPTARELPAEPRSSTIRLFCEALSENGHRSIRPPTEANGRFPLSPSAEQRLNDLFQTLFTLLRYESVYLLIDGADAYTQDPPSILRIIEPLLSRLRDLAERGIFAKFFLPDDVAPLIPDTLLTKPTRVIIINWARDSLAAILRERLYVASEGMYDALEAIATRDIPSPAGERLADAACPPVPREVILLAERVFTEHIRRVGPYGLLEAADFEDAFRWYRAQRGAEERGRG